MQIIPAVDIKNGKCVRLTQGIAGTDTIYEDDPLKAALRWQNEGAGYLHIVDLDGAFSGDTVNFEIIKRILSSLKIPAEIGGGIRTLDNIKKYIDAGADRVILGTQAAAQSSFIEKAISIFGDKIAVSIDASSGNIVIEGWTKKLDTFAVDLAKKVRQAGVKTIIYTDIATDGMLKGPNFKSISEFAGVLKNDIIASGGVSDIEDIKKISKIKGVTGIIIGKALYTEKIKLAHIIHEMS